MGALSRADTRFRRPRDVRLQDAGSRPTPDALRSDCRDQGAFVEFVARPWNRPGEPLSANRENRPRGASHSLAWAPSAPSLVPTGASGSKSTSRNANISRLRISVANLPPQSGGDRRVPTRAAVASPQLASKGWLPVCDRESQEFPSRGSSLDICLRERQGPTPTAGGLRASVPETLAAGCPTYRCGKSAEQKNYRTSNGMHGIHPNATVSTGCTSRGDPLRRYREPTQADPCVATHPASTLLPIRRGAQGCADAKLGAAPRGRTRDFADSQSRTCRCPRDRLPRSGSGRCRCKVWNNDSCWRPCTGLWTWSTSDSPEAPCPSSACRVHGRNPTPRSRSECKSSVVLRRSTLSFAHVRPLSKPPAMWMCRSAGSSSERCPSSGTGGVGTGLAAICETWMRTFHPMTLPRIIIMSTLSWAAPPCRLSNFVHAKMNRNSETSSDRAGVLH